jgi:enoyl-CoA hydratase
MFQISNKDAVTTLTLSRPPVNAISEEWVAAFDAKLDELAKGPRCTVLHIRSDQKVFCAGADLKEVRARMDAPDGADRMYSYVASIQRLYARIEQLPQVTLAEIGGAAMGGGFELALACDLRIAAAEAKLGLPEARLGLIPGAGGTQRLTRLCGRAVACRLILGAEIVDGTVASQLGLVQWTAPRAELAQRAGEIASAIARLPAGALAASKKCIAAAAPKDRSGYTDELEFTRLLLNDPETRQRVDAFLAGAAESSKSMKKGAA